MNTRDLFAAQVLTSISLEAASNDTTRAFFKAYTQVSPKIKKAKSKEALALIEEATAAMNRLSKALGARPGGKKSGKGGFANLKHAPKKDRM